MTRIRIVPFVLFMALMFAGCPKPELVKGYSDAGEFARNLFKIAREGNAREWGTQLTEARRAQGAAYVQTHFDNWSKMLNQLETTFGVPIQDVNFRKNDNGLEF